MTNPKRPSSGTSPSVVYENTFKLRRSQFPKENESESHYWACAELLRTYFKPKANPNTNVIEFCETLCRRAIQHSPFMKKKLKRDIGFLPNSAWYNGLVSILENSGRYAEAVSVAEVAKAEGWGGRNWDVKISSLRKKACRAAGDGL